WCPSSPSGVGGEHAEETCRLRAPPARPSRAGGRRERWLGQSSMRAAAGLDVHQQTVVACLLLSAPDGQVRREVRSFGTMTADLLALNDWRNLLGVEQVALQRTGVYWRPVFNLLEADHLLSSWSTRNICRRCQAARRM